MSEVTRLQNLIRLHTEGIEMLDRLVMQSERYLNLQQSAREAMKDELGNGVAARLRETGERIRSCGMNAISEEQEALIHLRLQLMEAEKQEQGE